MGGQVGIQGQAYQEGNPEVGSLVGVLACQGVLNRSRQGVLKPNREMLSIRFSICNAPGGIIPMPRPAGIPRPGPTGNCKGVT